MSHIPRRPALAALVFTTVLVAATLVAFQLDRYFGLSGRALSVGGASIQIMSVLGGASGILVTVMAIMTYDTSLRHRVSLLLRSAVSLRIPRSSSSDARPPGSFLVLIGQLIYSRRTYSVILEPAISDMQIEYFEAVAKNRRGLARWIEVRGHLIFAATLVAHAMASAGKTVSKIWKIIP